LVSSFQSMAYINIIYFSDVIVQTFYCYMYTYDNMTRFDSLIS
jgi:hypothetical protein